MVSMAPVCSPTPIIWQTMGGNCSVRVSGSARLLPSSTSFRTMRMASSITALPAVRAVMSRDSRIATPELRSVPRVRQNRATAIFRSRRPMAGSLSISLSSW